MQVNFVQNGAEFFERRAADHMRHDFEAPYPRRQTGNLGDNLCTAVLRNGVPGNFDGLSGTLVREKQPFDAIVIAKFDFICRE
ncbi:hypothetical protein AGMMS4952_26730 [Spirochaetia bacterium]|nr:hypothetical protein AGMMS4952_26730 [Spirochaetia bacterium]